MNINRRNFLWSAASGTVGLAAIPAILSASMPTTPKKSKGLLSSLNKGDVILFQGDSITDAGREKEKQLANSPGSFGSGYAFLTASGILNEHASKELTIYNRGISGNKVFQLADRWQKDCFDLSPNLLSILIGVNDFWHKLNGNYKGTVETYETDLRQLLMVTKKMLPDVKLVIGEPFAVLGCTAVDEKWFPEFNGYRNSAKKLATEFNAVFIPFHTIFEEAKKHAPATYWTADGVHPSMAGSALMAEAWEKAVS
ncbi:MAG: SGNH/GDSL hydrolase family protein [Bacteroidota bacterium]|nr:SGNH/GDSL hydrolase family protein [Bacteroidota bacterium]MDO9614543.1 SGNH/GDSL hydrolase family protein [Bacteroidota bacterium]